MSRLVKSGGGGAAEESSSEKPPASRLGCEIAGVCGASRPLRACLFCNDAKSNTRGSALPSVSWVMTLSTYAGAPSPRSPIILAELRLVDEPLEELEPCLDEYSPWADSFACLKKGIVAFDQKQQRKTPSSKTDMYDYPPSNIDSATGSRPEAGRTMTSEGLH